MGTTSKYIITKIFECHLSNQLLSFLNKFDILSKHQSGFSERHSCQTALFRLIDEWPKEIDSAKIIGSVFVDLKKAFDLVDHEISLHKLRLHHFSERSLALFKSYLNDRKQFIKHNNKFSSPRILTSGVVFLDHYSF